MKQKGLDGEETQHLRWGKLHLVRQMGYGAVLRGPCWLYLESLS